MVKANCCTCDENLLLSSTHSLQEGNEGHEAFIVGGLAELLHQGLALVLGVLAGLVHGKHVGLGQHLLSLLGGASDLGDGLEGGVEVAGTDEVAGVEGIDLAISLEVIDIEGEVDGLDFLLLQTKFSHCYSVVIKGIASQDYLLTVTGL